MIWKSDLTDKMKRSFFQAAVVSILLYGCTTWTLTKRMEKKLDSNYTRMLRAILNKSWRQHSTKQLLYGRLSPITKTIKFRRIGHAGHCWSSRDELISDILFWTTFSGPLCPAGWDCRIYRLHLCRGVRPPERVSWIWHITVWWWGSSDAGALGTAEYPFNAIAPGSTLARSGSTW